MRRTPELNKLLGERSDALAALYAARRAFNQAQMRERNALAAIDDYYREHPDEA